MESHSKSTTTKPHLSLSHWTKKEHHTTRPRKSLCVVAPHGSLVDNYMWTLSRHDTIRTCAESITKSPHWKYIKMWRLEKSTELYSNWYKTYDDSSEWKRRMFATNAQSRTTVTRSAVLRIEGWTLIQLLPMRPIGVVENWLWKGSHRPFKSNTYEDSSLVLVRNDKAATPIRIQRRRRKTTTTTTNSSRLQPRHDRRHS